MNLKADKCPNEVGSSSSSCQEETAVLLFLVLLLFVFGDFRVFVRAWA